MQDFYSTLLFANLVIDCDRAMCQPAHPRSVADEATHSRKSPQQFNVIEQRFAKTRRSVFVIFCDMADELSEIR